MNPYESPADTGEYNKYHDPMWYGYHLCMLPIYLIWASAIICASVAIVIVITPFLFVVGLSCLPRRVFVHLPIEDVIGSLLCWLLFVATLVHWYLWTYYRFDYVDHLIRLCSKASHLGT